MFVACCELCLSCHPLVSTTRLILLLNTLGWRCCNSILSLRRCFAGVSYARTLGFRRPSKAWTGNNGPGSD